MTGTKKSTKPINKNTKSLSPKPKKRSKTLGQQETLKSLKKRSIETSESPNDGWVRANRSEQSNLRERGFIDSRKECLAVELSQKIISNLEKNAKKSGLSLSEFAEKTLRDAAKI